MQLTTVPIAFLNYPAQFLVRNAIIVRRSSGRVCHKLREQAQNGFAQDESKE
jgi:hypothetical protein